MLTLIERDLESYCNNDDHHHDDDDPYKIPNLHLGFFLLVFILKTVMVMMMMILIQVGG